MSVQKRLKKMNYNPGMIDGCWGSGISGALSGFLNDRPLTMAAPTSLEIDHGCSSRTGGGVGCCGIGRLRSAGLGEAEVRRSQDGRSRRDAAQFPRCHIGVRHCLLFRDRDSGQQLHFASGTSSQITKTACLATRAFWKRRRDGPRKTCLYPLPWSRLPAAALPFLHTTLSAA